MASTTTTRPPRRVPPRDESAVEPYRVTPKLALRVAILGGILLAIFAALFLRLWALQVLAGQKYVDQAQANSFRTLPVPAKRGLIFDRNGVPLVTNTPTTAIQLWPSDLPRPYGPELARLARIARVPMYEIVRGIQKRKLSGDVVTPVTVRESASNLMVNYLRPLQSGTVTATGRVLRAGRRLITVSADVHDDQGNLAATALSTYLRLAR